jgi:hypothetical protein
MFYSGVSEPQPFAEFDIICCFREYFTAWVIVVIAFMVLPH